MSIPAHLVTREFWAASRQALKLDGVMLANLILDGRAGDALCPQSGWRRSSRSMAAAGIDVPHRGQAVSNVVVVCYSNPRWRTCRFTAMSATVPIRT